AQFVSAPVVIYADQSAAPPASAPVRVASANRPNMGGGFIEFLFSDGQGQGYQPYDQADRQRPLYPQQQIYQQQPYQSGYQPQQTMQQPMMGEPARPAFDPKFEKQMVDYSGKESAGTIVVD